MTGNETLYIALALGTAVAAGLVGAFALLKKMSLASDAMSHIALPGLGLAVLYNLNPLLGGAAALLIGAVLIWKITQASDINADAVIGVVFAVSLAIGSLITPQKDLIEALFGGMGGYINLYEFIGGSIVALVIVFFVVKKRHALILSLVSKDLARTSGINTDKLNLYFLLTFSLAIILGLKYLGVLLMGALIIIPPAIAKNLARNLNSMLGYSAGAALVSTAVGLFLSLNYGLALGPLIIITAGALFVLSLGFSRKR